MLHLLYIKSVVQLCEYVKKKKKELNKDWKIVHTFSLADTKTFFFLNALCSPGTERCCLMIQQPFNLKHTDAFYRHFKNYAYLLSCQEFDEKIDTT